jgi:hypothetical protein
MDSRATHPKCPGSSCSCLPHPTIAGLNNMITPIDASQKHSATPVADELLNNTNFARILRHQAFHLASSGTNTRPINQTTQQEAHGIIGNISSGLSTSSRPPPASQLAVPNIPVTFKSTQDQKRKASEMLQNERVKRQRLTGTACGPAMPPRPSPGASLQSQSITSPTLLSQMDGMRLSPSLDSPLSASGSSRANTVGLREVR